MDHKSQYMKGSGGDICRGQDVARPITLDNLGNHILQNVSSSIVAVSISGICMGTALVELKFTYLVATFSLCFDVSWLGCRDMKSEGLSVPFVWTIEKLYSCRCGFHLSIRAGGFDFGLLRWVQLACSLSAAWSDLRRDCYRWRCSTAQTIASASFSVCEYVSLLHRRYIASDLLSNATILRSSCLAVCWERIADSPHGEAYVMSSSSVCFLLSK